MKVVRRDDDVCAQPRRADSLCRKAQVLLRRGRLILRFNARRVDPGGDERRADALRLADLLVIALPAGGNAPRLRMRPEIVRRGIDAALEPTMR